MRTAGFLVLAVALAGCCAGEKKTSGQPDPGSLYVRMGGLNGLARATDEMVNRVLTDKVVLANVELQKRAKPENVPGLKVQITILLSSLAGGPLEYSGRSMKEAHSGMQVTGAQWAAFMKDCSDGMDAAMIAPKERDEMLAILASMKGDIVEAK